MNPRYTGFVLTALAVMGFLGWYHVETLAAQDKPAKPLSGEKKDRTPSVGKQPDETARLRRQVESARVEVAADGYYVCCIKPACSWCLLHLGKCVCSMGVGSGKGACLECHGGWEAGRGSVPGKT